MLRKSLIALALALAASLGGCTSLGNAIGVLTSTSISPTAVIVAANSFDALEATMTVYLKLPTCSGVTTKTPVCKTPAAVAAIVPAIRSGRTARNSLEALVAANNNAAIPVASYDTLTAAVSTLSAISTQYGINVAAP